MCVGVCAAGAHGGFALSIGLVYVCRIVTGLPIDRILRIVIKSAVSIKRHGSYIRSHWCLHIRAVLLQPQENQPRN